MKPRKLENYLTCSRCGDEYDKESRIDKPGRITECNLCAEETAIKYTGVMIYGHKTGCQIQINADPALTKYIINSTKLRNKGSNLGNNLKVSGKVKTINACLYLADENKKGK